MVRDRGGRAAHARLLRPAPPKGLGQVYSVPGSASQNVPLDGASAGATMGAVRLDDDDALTELLDGLGVGLDLNFIAPRIEPLLDALIRGASKPVPERSEEHTPELHSPPPP